MTTSLTTEQAFSLFEAAKKNVRDAQIAESKALDILVAANGGNKTFNHNGQLYQVRSRYNKDLELTLNFICQLKTSPKEWLQAAREQRMDAPTPTQPVEVESSTLETVQESISQAESIQQQLAEQFETGMGDPKLPSERRAAALSTDDLFGATVADDGTVTLD